MTKIVFDVVDVAGEVQPGDSVVVWPPRVNSTADGKVKNTRPETIRVDDGPVTRDLDPGPLWVQLQCGDRADTDPKLIRIPDPDEFDFEVTLRFLLDKVFIFDEVLESWAYENAERAEQAALDAIAARDRSEAGADLSQDSAAVSVAAALGLEDVYEDRITGLEAMSGIAAESPIDGQTANLISQPDTLTRSALDGKYPSIALTSIIVPKEITYDAIQAALSQASGSIKTVVAGGEITTDKTTHIDCNADLSRLKINYTGSGIAVIIGEKASGKASHAINVYAPRVSYSAKAGTQKTGWDAGSVGMQINNLNSSQVMVPEVANFETGLKVVGDAYGTSYNIITIGWLNNNKINLWALSAAGGWVNENTFIGGRFMHIRAEGEESPGTRQILLTRDSDKFGGPNNNLFIHPSLENVVAEYHADFDAASENTIYMGRWEVSGGARVRWGEEGYQNTIQGGYGSDNINQEWHPKSRFGRNSILGTSTASRGFSRNGEVWEHTGSNSYPVLTIMPLGSMRSGADPETGFTQRFSSNAYEAKNVNDTHPRVRISPSLGRVYLGKGASDPSVYFQGADTGALFGGGFFGPSSDNSLDIGAASFRPRDVYAARYVRLGSLVLRDNNGVLEKSSDRGATWTPIG